MPEANSYFSARPTVLVRELEQRRITDELLSMLVEETIDGLFRCELKVSNWGPKSGRSDFLFFDRDPLDFGVALAVEAGAPDHRRRIFSGRVMGLEAEYPADRPPELSILAEDRLQDLRMKRRTRSFENVSDADVAQQIATAHGLTPQIDHNGPTWAVMTQVNQSDLAFLRERAADGDALLRTDDATIVFAARGSADEGTVPLMYGRELREFTVLADLAHQRTSVRVTGWDVSAKQAVSATASSSAITSELGSLTGGGDVLATALGERVEQYAHTVPFTETEARALAESRYRESARRFVTGLAHAEGDARVRVGAIVELSGIGAVFSGRYAVVEARHTFDGVRGYRTTFRVQRAGIGS